LNIKCNAVPYIDPLYRSTGIGAKHALAGLDENHGAKVKKNHGILLEKSQNSRRIHGANSRS